MYANKSALAFHQLIAMNVNDAWDFDGLKISQFPFTTPLAIFVTKELCGEFKAKPVTSDLVCRFGLRFESS